tara:strand:- start:242 stop:355 length:114 start_codon:yes stop_codon:yes gene_type:complete
MNSFRQIYEMAANRQGGAESGRSLASISKVLACSTGD